MHISNLLNQRATWRPSRANRQLRTESVVQRWIPIIAGVLQLHVLIGRKCFSLTADWRNAGLHVLSAIELAPACKQYMVSSPDVKRQLPATVAKMRSDATAGLQYVESEE